MCNWKGIPGPNASGNALDFILEGVVYGCDNYPYRNRGFAQKRRVEPDEVGFF